MQCILPALEREGTHRPTERARWGGILAAEPCILAGDFNVHSPAWNPHCIERRDARFLEDLLDAFELEALNDDTERGDSQYH